MFKLQALQHFYNSYYAELLHVSPSKMNRNPNSFAKCKAKSTHIAVFPVPNDSFF
jgi:hypothetical protein